MGKTGAALVDPVLRAHDNHRDYLKYRSGVKYSKYLPQTSGRLNNLTDKILQEIKLNENRKLQYHRSFIEHKIWKI
jgi:hypothetical protein